jgi:hypothetical protein
MFARYGFTRKWSVHTLSHHSILKAVFLVNQSNLGLNLSELINSIKVIVIDHTIPWEILSNATEQLLTTYKMEMVPIMVYPHDYMDSQRVPYDKKYYMWILDAQYGKEFLDYMQNIFSKVVRSYFRHLVNQVLRVKK